VRRRKRPSEPTPPEVVARLRQLEALVSALAPLASLEMVGQPFGEGFGLEEAVRLVPLYIPNPSDVRENDISLAVSIIMEPRIRPDDLSEVMGATETAFQAAELPPAHFGPVENLAGVAQGFLGDFVDKVGIYGLWERRDDVAAEFLCWHAEALMRLATIGKADPIGQ
jgi:hypothetical protein